MKRLFSTADIILFIAIIVIAAAGIVIFSGTGAGQSALVRLNGAIVREVPLDTNQTFQVDGVQIEVRDGAIAFIHSSCPGQECVHAGFMRIPGASAACLPNRVSVTVTGKSEVDAIAE